MVAAAFAFYAIQQQDLETSSRIYEQSPDLMLYAEQEVYNMTRGDTLKIPIVVEILQKGKEVDAQIAIFGNGTEIPAGVFVETGETTLPVGFTGSLDRSRIYLPPDDQGETKIETVFLTLTSKEGVGAGDHVLSPTLFSKDVAGTPFTVSSSFVVHVE
ncbi:MAG TPA: hypothetical protein VGQ03_04885 [Nitrososphaera sp.]|jgi:hypothetical protein|nr:hypothetical protein [Nitrososphaera sp.]